MRFVLIVETANGDEEARLLIEVEQEPEEGDRFEITEDMIQGRGRGCEKVNAPGICVLMAQMPAVWNGDMIPGLFARRDDLLTE